MATTTPLPEVRIYRDEDYFFFEGGGWELYDQLDAWAGERAGVRITYTDGDVVVRRISRRHHWFTKRIDNLVWALAHAAGIPCEDAGATTFREKASNAGAQADQTYYFGPHAVQMLGPKNVEPGVDPVPDLAIEVQVGDPVTLALQAWARLGVPEVWHLDASRDELRLRMLRLPADGTPYAPAVGSGFLPATETEILELLMSSLNEGSQAWQALLAGRVAQVLDARGRTGSDEGQA